MKAENMLGKVIKKLKLEKENSKALKIKNEEPKNMIVKIGVDLNGRFVVQKLLQSVESKIFVMKKKLKLEKENSRALTIHNEELKKIIVKIGVDPNENSTV